MDTTEDAGLIELSFEEAFSRLEDAVLKLEHGGLTIDDMVDRFSEGMALIKVCYQKLDSAQARVTVLQREAEDVTRLEVEESVEDDDDQT